MPRKHRDLRKGLKAKGFSEESNRKHIHFIYETLDGKTTAARTMISHSNDGDDISDNLIGRMAKQVSLGRLDFLNLVDCPMPREHFDAIVLQNENGGDDE